VITGETTSRRELGGDRRPGVDTACEEVSKLAARLPDCDPVPASRW
jgi:hypothetical protein